MISRSKNLIEKLNLKALENYSQERLSTDQKLSCQVVSYRLNRIIQREDVIRAPSNKDTDYTYHLKEQTTLELSPEKVYEAGLREVERINKKMIEFLKQKGLWNQRVSIGAYFKQLNNSTLYIFRSEFRNMLTQIALGIAGVGLISHSRDS